MRDYSFCLTCGDLVSRTDFSRHARGHGPGRAPSTCFPTAVAISAGCTLAIVEEHASASCDCTAAQSDHIYDFLVHIAATIDHVHAGIRHLERAPAGAIASADIPEKLARILQEPLRMMLIAPIAFGNLRVAWTRAPAAENAREHFSDVAPSIDRMTDTLNSIRPLRDPMSDRAIAAYGELSPRLAERLIEVRTLWLRKFRSPLDLHPFFATAVPDLRKAAPHISLIEPTLSAYLPRELP